MTNLFLPDPDFGEEYAQLEGVDGYLRAPKEKYIDYWGFEQWLEVPYDKIHLRIGIPSQLSDQIVSPGNNWVVSFYYDPYWQYWPPTNFTPALEDAFLFGNGLNGKPSIYEPGEEGRAILSLYKENIYPLRNVFDGFSFTQQYDGVYIQAEYASPWDEESEGRPAPKVPIIFNGYDAKTNRTSEDNPPYFRELYGVSAEYYGDLNLDNFWPAPSSPNPNTRVVSIPLSVLENVEGDGYFGLRLNTYIGNIFVALAGANTLEIHNYPSYANYPKSLEDIDFNSSIFYGTVPVSSDFVETTINATLFARASAYVPAVYFTLWDTSPPPARPSGNQQIKPPVFEPLFGVGSNLTSHSTNSIYAYAPFYANAIGNFAKMFAEQDFYERIQYQFVVYNFGTVLSPKQKTLWVWNAFRTEKELENIDQIDFGGLTLSGPAFPDNYSPLQQKTYTIDASVDGPEFIDAVLGFYWEGGIYNQVALNGRRVIVWSWKPDWARPVTERLEWKTDVITSYKGEEQRRSLRRAPRRYAEFYTGAIEPHDRRIMETAIFGWGSKNWALPIWWDGRQTTQDTPAGSFEIYADTVYADLQAGQSAILYSDSLNYETVDISAVFADRIELVSETLGYWPAGTILYPLRSAKIDGSLSVERWSGSSSFENVRFIFEQAANYAESQSFPTHNGYPVLEAKPNWVDSPQLAFNRKTMIFDPGIGLRSYEDQSGIPVTTQRQKHTFLTKQESDSWRKYLYAMRGPQRAMYVPTWASDLRVVATIQNSDAVIDVEHTNRTLLIGQAAGRRNIRVQLTSGQIFYRSIVSSFELNETTERFSISSPFGIQIQPSQIELISYMSLSRFDSDAFEFAWWSGDVCDVSVSLRSFNHAV